MLIILLDMIEDDEDKELFEKLYYQHRRLLLGIADGILQDYHLAEDVTQETFVRLTKNLGKIRNANENQMRHFLAITAERIALNLKLKKEKRREMIDFDSIADELENGYDLIDEILSEIATEMIKEKIEKLPENDSGILSLRYLSAVGIDEIAIILGIRKGTARKRLERAKKRLLISLQKEYIDDNEQ